MTELDETLNKPFRDATEDDINRFADMKARYCSRKSMVSCKTMIKTFYKWLFGLKDTYPPAVGKLETNTRRYSNGGGNAEDLDIKDVLTKDDITLLIKNCQDDREEAMITRAC